MKSQNIQDIAVKHNYLLTVAQVAELAREYVTAQQSVSSIGQATYLRVEIAGTIKELGAEPRQRSRKGDMGKLSEEEKARQLAALEAVHSRYYAAILEAVIEDGIKDHPRLGKEERARRSLERNRRTNYARSAKSTIAAYIRAGFDITTLVVASVTKRSLYEAVQITQPPKVAEPEKLERQLSSSADRLSAMAKELCEKDGERARGPLVKLLNELTHLLMATGVHTTDKPAEAQEQCVPLMLKTGVFWPAGVETRQ